MQQPNGRQSGGLSCTAAWILVFTALMAARPAAAQDADSAQGAAGPSTSELAGTWVGTLSHAGETRSFGLRLEATADGKLLVKMSNPALHISELPIGKAAIEPAGLRLGSFALAYDRAAGTLSGVMPDSFVPIYKLPVVFHRGALEPLPRPEPDAPIARAVWAFDAASPIWADAAFAGGVVYVGAEDGQLHAIDARTGKLRWSYKAGGAIRARPSVAGGNLFVQADDGFLYRLDAATGKERWKVRVASKPIVRLPLSNPESRWDSFASAVTFGRGRLYVGTFDGHVLALDAATGARAWDFAAGDSVLSTPQVEKGRVYFGSFDGCVYAVDAASGALAWKRDTGAPVVSAPAIHGGHVIVGSRSYDLLGLDAATGAPAWTRYVWFSWIESSATIRDGTAYVGSSDAAKLFALDPRTGASRWELDAWGSAWGQPAVTDARVFIGTYGTAQYLIRHRGGVIAADRRTGRMAWRFPLAEPPDGSAYGFAGAPAVGAGRVFIGGLDGRVYAFAQ